MQQQDTPLDSPLFEALAELSFESVMVTRAGGPGGDPEVVYVNARFTELTGYRADEVIGGTPGLLQGPDTDTSVTKRLADDISNGRTFHGQTVNYRKDGTPFEIEWKVTPVSADGQTTYHVAVQRDVTER